MKKNLYKFTLMEPYSNELIDIIFLNTNLQTLVLNLNDEVQLMDVIVLKMLVPSEKIKCHCFYSPRYVIAHIK